MTLATDRATALGATTNDLGQAGLIFNDAVRLSDGGLWSDPADSNNQLNYASMYEADISALKADITSAMTDGVTVNGTAVTPSNANTLSEILGQLNDLAAAAPQAVGNSATAIAAQGVIHTEQQQILSEIANDTNLQNALAANAVTNPGTGATDQGFQALPAQAADDAAAIATAKAGASLSDIGTVFNAATSLADGGLNSSNLAEFNTDMKAVAAGLQNFINNGGLAEIQANSSAEHALAVAEGISDSAAQALTGVHLQTVLNQIELQINDFDATYAANPNVAARATNDNLLDIIDIVQNDPALAASAGNPTATAANFTAGTFVPSHDGGFASQAGYLQGTITHYQDNQAQTDFWSAFIAGANNLNNALTAEANGTAHLDSAGLNALIQQVQGYEQLGASFDGAQGGIFGARFDNELLGGTLKADTNTALKALHDIANNGGTVSATDAAQLVAAGDGYVGDAQDVSGNNIPNGGGTYVGTATTVAGATTTQIADANSPTSGNVNGNDQPTNHPANGLTNDGFGVTDPSASAAANGHGSPGAGAGADPGSSATSMLSGAIAGDIASLVQALEGGQTSAVSTAIATLTAAITGNSSSGTGNSSAGTGSAGNNHGVNDGSSAADTGAAGIPDQFANLGHHHHFEHMWH